MEQHTRKQEILRGLEVILKSDEGVLSLSLFGSLANGEVEKDRWSDIDALIVVRDDALERFFPSVSWLSPLGDVFAIQQSSSEDRKTTRVIFKDFEKMDLVITTESAVKDRSPFWVKQKLVFSRSETISSILEERALEIVRPNVWRPYDLEPLVNEFWFVSFVAVTKVVRDDLLIALHLALDLYRDCLLLGMWLRDKETGTHMHRTGGTGADVAKRLDIRLGEISKENILSLIKQCGGEFDKLALQWSPGYVPRLPAFEKVLTLARKDLRQRDNRQHSD